MSVDVLFKGQPLSYWLHIRIDGNDEARWEAIDAIRHLCAPDDSVPLFLETLRSDSYWRARALAAHALYDLAFDQSAAIRLSRVMPDLLAAMNDPSAEVREQIGELLSLLENGGTMA